MYLGEEMPSAQSRFPAAQEFRLNCARALCLGGWLSYFCPTRLQDAIDHLTSQISSARSQMEQEQERFEKKFLEKIDHLFLAIKEKSVRLRSWGALKSIPTLGVIGRAQLCRPAGCTQCKQPGCKLASLGTRP